MIENIRIVSPFKSIPPSLIGVGFETSTQMAMGGTTCPTHLMADTVTHVLLNTVEFDSPKVANRVNRSTEAIVHLFGKYCSHTLVEKISYTTHVHADHIRTFGHNIHEHLHHHDVSMITVPIIMCLLAEQLYKFYFSKQLSSKSFL